MKKALTKKDLEPLKRVINSLSKQYPETSFSFEVRNYGKERLPEFAIYASDNWVKPCGCCHCNCGNTEQGGDEKFLEEINEMLNNEAKTKKAQRAKKNKLIGIKRTEIERLEDDIEELTNNN